MPQDAAKDAPMAAPSASAPAMYTYLNTGGVIAGIVRINVSTGAVEALEHTPAGWRWVPVVMA
jgi:hypothetical protein